MQTCSKYHIISYLVDACLIAGIFASAIYLARNTYADEPAATDDGEVIFTGAPPLTSTPISRDCPMTNLNTVEVVVDLSFSRDGYPEPINPSDAEDIGDRLLDLFVQVRIIAILYIAAHVSFIINRDVTAIALTSVSIGL